MVVFYIWDVNRTTNNRFHSVRSSTLVINNYLALIGARCSGKSLWPFFFFTAGKDIYLRTWQKPPVQSLLLSCLNFSSWGFDVSIVKISHERLHRFIKSILKSLVILLMWLVLSGAIYSRIALSFALNHIFFSANENGTIKQNNQSDFKAILNSPITSQENKGRKSHRLANLATWFNKYWSWPKSSFCSFI